MATKVQLSSSRNHPLYNTVCQSSPTSAVRSQELTSSFFTARNNRLYSTSGEKFVSNKGQRKLVIGSRVPNTPIGAPGNTYWRYPYLWRLEASAVAGRGEVDMEWMEMVLVQAAWSWRSLTSSWYFSTDGLSNTFGVGPLNDQRTGPVLVGDSLVGPWTVPCGTPRFGAIVLRAEFRSRGGSLAKD